MNFDEFLTVLDRILAESEARARAAGTESSLGQSIPIPKRTTDSSTAPPPLTAPGAPAAKAAEPPPGSSAPAPPATKNPAKP